MDRALSFLECFEELEDPRVRMKVLYPLPEMLLLCLCGVIAGCEDFTDIESYGDEKLDFLRTLLPFKHGIPSHDALNDLFRALDPVAFREAFVEWANGLADHIPGLVAIDGKTLRGSRDGAKSGIHLVSAWAGEQGLVLGQVKTSEKSNEITAIPQLLDLLTIRGAIVTIDAMGCQKAIARKIREKEADYVLALKANHGDLYDDVVTFFKHGEGRDLPVHETTDAGHGRIEVRRYTITDDIAWLIERNPGWEGLRGIGRVESAFTSKNGDGPPEIQVRYYICSIEANPKIFASAVRSHWSIENGLHWVLDVTFRDDHTRIRKDNAPENIALVKRIALNLINKNKGKRSIKNVRKRAAWNNNTLCAILTS